MPTIGIYELHTIPIKQVTPEQQSPFIILVDRILVTKGRNAATDIGEWEREIDQLVYKLYELTPEEIKIVEDATR